MSLIKLIENRTSIRKFNPNIPLDINLVISFINTATTAPSAGNL